MSEPSGMARVDAAYPVHPVVEKLKRQIQWTQGPDEKKEKGKG